MSDNSSEEKTVTIHLGDSTDENRQGGDGVDIMDLGSGEDTADAGRGYNVILGGSGDDNLTSDGNWDDVFGGSGDDTITVTGRNAWVFGGTGNDTIYGGDEALSFDLLSGGDGNDTIHGRGGWDLIFGGEGDDTIDGGTGHDFIVGGAGDDDLTGGSGVDTFYFREGHGTDTIQDFNAAEGDRIDLVGFDDTITWAQLSSRITTVVDENNAVTGVQIDLRDWGGGTLILNGITDVNDVTEDMFVLNVIQGDDDSDDILVGGASDDTMSGGTGADTFRFYEGSGNDTITDFSTTDGDKIDLTWFDASITWAQLQAAMTSVEDDEQTTDVDETATIIDLSAWGGGTITLNGVSATDLTEDMFLLHDLHGEDGVGNYIVGGIGDDTMSGGTGADVFYFYEGHGDDTITDFSATEGDIIDLNWFSQAITWEELSANITQVEDDAGTRDVDETATVIDLSAWGGGSITLQGVTATDLTADMFNLPDGTAGYYIYGGSGDDALEGTRGHDNIFGQEGDDAISGGIGHDWLFGGEGADTLGGGEGNDLLIGGEGNDTLDGGEGNDWSVGGEGADTFVFASGHGSDTIADFADGEDLIDLSAFTGIAGYGDLTVTQNGNDVVIDLSGQAGGGTITLLDFTLADLDENDFAFYEAPPDGG